MADGRVFDVRSNPAEKLSGKESLKDIVQFAIGMEKDSIVFYLGVKDMVPSALGKDKIDAIIREEMRHITILSKELSAR
jgi:rubrerythrin